MSAFLAALLAMFAPVNYEGSISVAKTGLSVPAFVFYPDGDEDSGWAYQVLKIPPIAEETPIACMGSQKKQLLQCFYIAWKDHEVDVRAVLVTFRGT